MTSDLLQCIVARRRERFGVSSTFALSHPLTGAFASSSSPSSPPPLQEDNRFLAALRAARGRAAIAEVKMGSPRLGSLAGRFDPLAQAAAYAEAGAACLSVVVEPDFFFGSYELLEACREESGLPAIAKDFVVSERQLDAAVEAGADAILLVASLYTEAALVAWAAAARARGRRRWSRPTTHATSHGSVIGPGSSSASTTGTCATSRSTSSARSPCGRGCPRARWPSPRAGSRAGRTSSGSPRPGSMPS